MDERISIVTDEISQDLSEVRSFLDEHRLGAVELRCVAGRRVPDLARPDRETLRSWAQAGDPAVLAVSPGLFKCAHDDAMEIARHLEEILPPAIELALELEARFLVTFSFETAGAPLDEGALDALRSAADACRAAGLPLLVENEPGFAAATGAELVRLLADVGRENLFVNWDPTNSNELDEPRLAAGLRAVAPRVRHVHVKNGRLAPGARFARYGPLREGDIDWPAHLRLLDGLGYEGYLGIETHFEPLRASSATVLRELRELLAEVRGRRGEG